VKIKSIIPFGLIIVCIAFFILGLIATPLIKNLATPEQLASNVLLNAIPFILIFISILLLYITILVIIGNLLNNRISERIYKIIETVLIVGIVVGVLSMFQPWSVVLYKYGFIVVLFSVLSYIIWSHTIPKKPVRSDELADSSLIESKQL